MITFGRTGQGRHASVLGLLVLGAGAVILWWVAHLVTPNLARSFLSLYGGPELGRASDVEIERISFAWTWLVAALAILATAVALGGRNAVGVVAAGVTAYSLYLFGTLTGTLEGMRQDNGWPSPEQMAYAFNLASGLLAVSVLACLVAVAVRGQWVTYLSGIFALVSMAAFTIGIDSALAGPFESPKPIARAEVTVKAFVIGAPLAVNDKVTVIFVIPKLNDAGTVSEIDQAARAALTAEPASCHEGTRCSVRLHVTRGDADSTLAEWLADRAAASDIYVVGPDGVPPATP